MTLKLRRPCTMFFPLINTVDQYPFWSTVKLKLNISQSLQRQENIGRLVQSKDMKQTTNKIEGVQHGETKKKRSNQPIA